MRWRVLDWQLDTKTKEVIGPNGLERPRRQVFEVFQLLLERAPAVVTKEELLEVVWEGRPVSDNAIGQVVRELRALLDDDPSAPRLIATRHRQGYQCVATVQKLPDQDLPQPAQRPNPIPKATTAALAEPTSGPTEAPGAASKMRWLFWISSLAVIGIGLTWWSSNPPPLPLSTAGWPTNSHATSSLERGLAAAHRLESAEALAAFESAAAVEDTPRLLAQRTRLLLRLGRTTEAEILASRLTSLTSGLGRKDQLLAEAVSFEIHRRPRQAAGVYAVLNTMHPTDIDYALAWWESQARAPRRNEAPDNEALKRVRESNKVPLERRLLLAAQAAGWHHDHKLQLSRAESALLASQTTAPVLAALATVERNTALAALGNQEAYWQESCRAIEGLLELGEVRAAFVALRGALRHAPDLSQATEPAAAFALGKLLESFTNNLGASLAPYQQAQLAYARGHQLDLAGNHTDALEAFVSAARQFRALDSPGVLEALRAQASTLQALGRTEQAQEVLLGALRLAETQPDAGPVGPSYLALARISAAQDRPEQAADYYERALAELRQARQPLSEALALSDLSKLHLGQGNLDRARLILDQALPLARQAQASRAAAHIARQRAWLALLQGELDVSQEDASAAAASFRDLGANAEATKALLLRCQVERYRADLEAVTATLREATGLQDGESPTEDWVVEQSHLLRERGRPLAARTTIERFRQGNPAASKRQMDFPMRLLITRLDLDSGLAAQAEKDIREVLSTALTSFPLRHQLAARELLARALLAQGDLAKAQDELDTADELLRQSPDFRVRLALALSRASLERIVAAQSTAVPEARSSHPQDARSTEARQRLQWVVDEAEKTGALLFAAEARVELLAFDPRTDQEAGSFARELERRGLHRLRQRLGPSISMRSP